MCATLVRDHEIWCMAIGTEREKRGWERCEGGMAECGELWDPEGLGPSLTK